MSVVTDPRRKWSVLCLSATVLAGAPMTAAASGIDIPENGTEVLARGGTDVGLLDTAYSLQFNPAGMAFVNGLDVRLETLITNPGESFQPSGQSTTVSNGQSTKVSNQGGLSFGPQIMAVYHPPSFHWLAFGLGVWGPPGVTNFSFPDPRPACCTATTTAQANNATAATPQRYEVISQNTIIAYPSVGLAILPIPQISIGATLQYVISSVQLSTALQGLPTSDAELFNYNPNSVQNDVIASINVNGKPRFTAVMGLAVNPIPNLMIGASFRPMIPIESSGTLGLGLGYDLQQLMVTATPATPNATLAIKLPPVVRVGASYKWGRLSSSLEYVWEGWSVNNDFTLTTNAVVNSPLGMTKVGTIQIPNNWQDTSSIRAGFGYDFLRRADTGGVSLQGDLGFLFDGNAIPSEWTKLPYVQGNTYGPTVGVSAGWKGLALNVGFAYYIPQSFTVNDSAVAKPAAPAPGSTTAPTPIYIGDGTYTTNVWVFSVGLSYSGFGA